VPANGGATRHVVHWHVVPIEALPLTGGARAPAVARCKPWSAELIGNNHIPVIDAALHLARVASGERQRKRGYQAEVDFGGFLQMRDPLGSCRKIEYLSM
jgi:hypothetical protein